jgi:hypothetical protein
MYSDNDTILHNTSNFSNMNSIDDDETEPVNQEIVYTENMLVETEPLNQEIVYTENMIGETEPVNQEIVYTENMIDEENAKLYWKNSKTEKVVELWNQNMKDVSIVEENTEQNEFDYSMKNELETMQSKITNDSFQVVNDISNTLLEKQSLMNSNDNHENIPKIIFIVPYRNREEHLEYFKKHIKIVLEDLPPESYNIYYIHQCDDRVFNRGAMKNIGFLMVKNKYPDHYKNITLVFNDVDSIPLNKNLLNYTTVPGVVKHFYGYHHTLGGIVSMNAYDFEKINGYPNFWAWGYEDNMLQQRAIKAKYEINRSNFFKIIKYRYRYLFNIFRSEYLTFYLEHFILAPQNV